jgi:hypothetical protein
MGSNLKKLLSAIILFCTYILSAQTTNIQYLYDITGNRTQKKLVVCNNCPPPINNQRHSAPPVDTTQTIITQHVIGVFPNPTQDMLNVNITNVETTETVNLFLSDETGRTLLNLKNQPPISIVNMANYKTGAYYLQVKVGNDNPKIYKVMKIE